MMDEDWLSGMLLGAFASASLGAWLGSKIHAVFIPIGMVGVMSALTLPFGLLFMLLIEGWGNLPIPRWEPEYLMHSPNQNLKVETLGKGLTKWKITDRNGDTTKSGSLVGKQEIHQRVAGIYVGNKMVIKKETV